MTDTRPETGATEAKLLDYLRRATTDLRASQRRVAELETAAHDAVAVVGMACRYPGGVSSAADLWSLVLSEQDAISDFPRDRGWDIDELLHTTSTQRGGFLRTVADFDASFFGISPREATAMAPQQRLALETCWEAVEDAGIAPTALRGEPVAVFLGSNQLDYGWDLPAIPRKYAGHLTTGSAGSVVSGRVAYALGLEGAAITIDTGCSSSLVAMHLAMRALRAHECTMALAGGVAVMASAAEFVGFSEQRGLAPDGRCKAFGALADGMGLAEGVGILVLERLSVARRNQHRVLAVLRGSAVNQDGASNGLTAPNGPSQQRVIRAALVDARLSAEQIDVVEGHGTGTSLGDLIEAQALQAAYGENRPPQRPLLVGSVKSNIGHTQAAAGVAGIIKMLMAMRHGILPATLHAEPPSAAVDWTTGVVSLLTERTEWPRSDRPRRAGVSSFGISGTNAHVIIEEAPAEPDPGRGRGRGREQLTTDATVRPPGDPAVAWVLSAYDGLALRAQAARLRTHLDAHPEYSVRDVAFSLAAGRAMLDERAVIIGSDRSELLAGLDAVARGVGSAAVVQGRAVVNELAFVFSGHGSQWPGMAVELLDSPVFAAEIAKCERSLAPHVDWSLMAVLRQQTDAPALERVDVLQPVLWAVAVSLAAVWNAAGVHPTAVVGHSVGEVAAAYVAGALSRDDAARVVARRAIAIADGIAGQGAMASVALTVAEVIERIDATSDALVVGAVNAPRWVAVSGTLDSIERFLDSCAEGGIRARRIGADYASHSPQVEPLRDVLYAAIDGIRPEAARLPLMSTVTADWVGAGTLDTEYWYTNLREPVRFADAIARMVGEGTRAFVELSPHPVLVAAIVETAESEEAANTTVTLSTLRRGDGGWRRVLRSFAEAFSQGIAIDWAGLFAGSAVQQVSLPTYPFQRRRYWMEAGSGSVSQQVAGSADETFWNAVDAGDLQALTTLVSSTEGDAARSLVAMAPALPVLAAWHRSQQAEKAVDSWRYRITWQLLSLPSASVVSGTWLAVVPSRPADPVWLHAVVKGLRARGATVHVVPVDTVHVDRAELTQHLRPHTDGTRGVISWLGVDGGPTHSAYPDLTASLAATVALIGALQDLECAAPLWCVTRQATSIGSGDRVEAPEQAQLWGLGRVAALELPNRWGGLVDLPDVLDDAALDHLARLLSGCGEDQVAVRGAGAFGRRLHRAAGQSADCARWTPSGTILVTGGTGALGTYVCRWLAGRGAERLLVISRQGHDAPGAAALCEELATTGCEVTVVACDVTDRDDLERVLRDVEGIHPVTAVFHLAGVLENEMVTSLRIDELARVCAPKLAAQHLHELTRELPLSAFVLFSSSAAVWGSGGQSAYAAGNAYVDALAEQRRADGLPATSVGWGAWGESGLAATAESESRLHRRGVLSMAPELALSALSRVLNGDTATPVVSAVDWSKFAPSFTALRASPLLADLLDAVAVVPPSDWAPTTSERAAALGHRLGELSPSDGRRLVLDIVRTHAAAALDHDTLDEVAPDRAFFDAGFDSLTAVDMRNRLAGETGLKLPTTVTFDHPTPVALADYLYTCLVPATGSGAVRGGEDVETLLGDLGEKLAAALDDDRSHEALGNGSRARVAARLRALAGRCEARNQVQEAADDGFASASTDDMLELISREFGKT